MLPSDHFTMRAFDSLIALPSLSNDVRQRIVFSTFSFNLYKKMVDDEQDDVYRVGCYIGLLMRRPMERSGKYSVENRQFRDKNFPLLCSRWQQGL